MLQLNTTLTNEKINTKANVSCYAINAFPTIPTSLRAV